MANYSAPKQWVLKENETITSYESWKQNLIFTLSLQNKFLPFLEEGCTWKKKTTADPYRGFVNDEAGDSSRTRQEKTSLLELMLGQIANFCPISRNIIVKRSTSLNDVWQQIRQYYGFQSTGAQFLALSSIIQKPEERPESLYQRLYAFFEDNLITKDGGILHHGEKVEADEEITPTLENTITWLWLKLLHNGLPDMVRQKYGTELRNKSLASLKDEISQALPSLLDDIQSVEDSKVFRAAVRPSTPYSRPFRGNKSRSTSKTCVLCKTAGRPHTHWLTECRFLPDDDRRALARARVIQDAVDIPVEESSEQEEEQSSLPQLPVTNIAYGIVTHTAPEYSVRGDNSIACRVTSMPSGVLDCYYRESRVCTTIDSGATSNMIKAALVKFLGIRIHPSTQLACQADGKTPLTVVGEVHTEFTLGKHVFVFDGLVIEELEVDILGGMPFMAVNDIAIRPHNSTLIIKWKEVITFRKPQLPVSSNNKVRRAFVLRGPDSRTVVLPGESVSLKTPQDTEDNINWAMEPRRDNVTSCSWLKPQEVEVVNHTITLMNTSCEPVIVDKHAHVCHIHPIFEVPDINTDILEGREAVRSTQELTKPVSNIPFSYAVTVDPDNIVTVAIKQKVHDINRSFDMVFNPSLPVYNGHSGKICGNVNMGPVLPPQRKGRLPHYNHEKMVLLQKHFDDLERAGVFVKPEEAGVTAEYLNMSFLTAKPGGGERLVTAFGEVGQYSKPQPSVMPNVNDTLRIIGQWKYLIKTDLSKAFYQIPLNKASMRFCGVATPFKGVRLYARCAMGMPGSETALEELMNRIFGHLVQEGVLAKIADDMYCGGNTPEETLDTWSRVLKCLADNNLGISASKTVVFPKSTVTLGWIWCGGTLKASAHRTAALAAVKPPSTVRALKSFIGAYKVLSRVIKGYAEIMQPLEHAVAGKSSLDKVNWTDELRTHFQKAQDSLSECKVITIPRPDDALWIVTDGAVTCGVAATLFLMREGQRKLGGFYNSQLRKGQSLWLPCEVEALSISMAINHFAPFIIQSHKQTHLITDNKPCSQAYQRLCRGLFSNSARVTTFISAVCRYQIIVSHIKGAKIPLTDYGSRNTVECPDNSCQVCKFVDDASNSVVREISVQDVLKGKCTMPFVNRSAWLVTQRDCPDLRRVHAHLHQGTRPSKKMTQIRNIKRYLHVAVIARDGLLVVRETLPFQGVCERIIVPSTVIHGLLTAVHLQFNHPSTYQIKRLTERYFFAINLDKVCSEVTEACHTCNFLKTIPLHMIKQSSTSPPDQIGTVFSLDVLKRYKQHVLVLRENVSSYTATMFVDDEGKKTLRSGIIGLASAMSGCGKSVRIDPGPGLAALVDDSELQSHGIKLDLGRVKNCNKNPVAERAIEELGLEILKISPDGGPISNCTLALATANMNARVRRDGLSSFEIWTQRDQVTGVQLPICDQDIIQNQHQSRLRNHLPSAKSKARGKHSVHNTPLTVGSLVYIDSDKDKTKARNKYIIVSVDGEWCRVQKFVKSQYRSKPYNVKMSEIYPISTNVLHTNNGPQNCFEESSESDVEFTDDDEFFNDKGRAGLQIDEHISSSDHSSSGEDEDPQNVLGDVQMDVNHQRMDARPYREKSKPAWMKDYVLY